MVTKDHIATHTIMFLGLGRSLFSIASYIYVAIANTIAPSVYKPIQVTYYFNQLNIT